MSICQSRRQYCTDGRCSASRGSSGPSHGLTADWSHSSALFREAQADILTIFDLYDDKRGSGSGSESDEYASPQLSIDMVTENNVWQFIITHGSKPSTPDIIDALKRQSGSFENIAFTTDDLVRAISKLGRHCTFSASVSTKHIILARTPEKMRSKPSDNVHTKRPFLSQSSYLKLGFAIQNNTLLTPKAIQTLARDLANAALRSKIAINAIDCLGFQQSDDFTYRAVVKAANHWRKMTIGNRKLLQFKLLKDPTF